MKFPIPSTVGYNTHGVQDLIYYKWGFWQTLLNNMKYKNFITNKRNFKFVHSTIIIWSFLNKDGPSY